MQERQTAWIVEDKNDNTATLTLSIRGSAEPLITIVETIEYRGGALERGDEGRRNHTLILDARVPIVRMGD